MNLSFFFSFCFNNSIAWDRWVERLQRNEDKVPGRMRVQECRSKILVELKELFRECNAYRLNFFPWISVDVEFAVCRHSFLCDDKFDRIDHVQ